MGSRAREVHQRIARRQGDLLRIEEGDDGGRRRPKVELHPDAL
jgi:hypothetical protein